MTEELKKPNFSLLRLTKKLCHKGPLWQSRAVVRALASHQCGPGLNPGVNATCGLSLLLVLSLIVLRGFSLLQGAKKVCFTACH